MYLLFYFLVQYDTLVFLHLNFNYLYLYPLNIDYNIFCFNSDVKNHASALRNEAGVDKYFMEVTLGAMAGPLDSSPFEKTHYSPLMNRSKPDGGTRVIVDLSWPINASVNSCVPLNYIDFLNFQLKYPNIDNLVQKIRILGPSTVLFKIDLQRAFRNLRIDPLDYQVLALSWRSVAVRISPRCLPVNLKKVSAPTQKITCLGIDVDAKEGILSVPKEKLQKIMYDMAKYYTQAASIADWSFNSHS